MARSMYQNTIAAADATGTLKALAGIQIFVYGQGTQNTVPIYQSRIGASQKTNPIVTDATGLVEFYADVGEYDVRVKDTNVSARIADRTVQWHSVSGADGGTPGAKIASDAGLSLGTLAADVNRQIAQIGQVIDWWRPDDTFPVPNGWEICDGRSILAGNHEFGGGSITLPDLRNAFVLGADANKINGTGGTNGDTSAGAPAIRGLGGSNAAKDFTHQHAIPNHTHSGTSGTENSSLAHNHVPVYQGGNNNHFAIWAEGDTLNNQFAPGPPVASDRPIYRSTLATEYGGPAPHTHNITVGSGVNASTNPNTISTNWTANPGTDMRPRYVGLLKIMKVRRS